MSLDEAGRTGVEERAASPLRRGLALLFNWTGLAMAALTFFVLQVTDNPLVASVALIAGDAMYRIGLRGRDVGLFAALFSPRGGGHLLSVPAWIWGGVLLLFPRILGVPGAGLTPPPAPPAVE